MKTAIILCSGKGTKIFPYAEIRNKSMIPVSGKKIIEYTTDALEENGIEKIIIVASKFNEEIRNTYKNNNKVSFVIENEVKGTAFSLFAAKESVKENDFLVFYGDTIISSADVKSLIEAHKRGRYTALISPVPDRTMDRITCTVMDGKIAYILGHSRDEGTHILSAFAFSKEIFSALACNSRRFTSTEVGMMPPVEGYIEMSLVDEMNGGKELDFIEAGEKVFDIDKPWHILEANDYINKKLCGALKENILADGATIDSTAFIDGFVKLGKNSRIGRNVTIKGNLIVGDNTIIDTGAIIEDSCVIGNDVVADNCCFIAMGSTVGDYCRIHHCAELCGILFNNSYLYHYMEINGILGENVDIGAATVCGSLRFDDGITQQRVNGRKEALSEFCDSVFIGDYCRTGVNAILMPGVKVGAYSVIGAGVMLKEDLECNTLIYSEQNQIKKKWGSEKYGW